MLSIWPFFNSVLPTEKSHGTDSQSSPSDPEVLTEDEAIEDFVRTVERFNKAVKNRHIKAPAHLGGFDSDNPVYSDEESK